MAAPDATLAGNPMLTRAIAAGQNTYAGFGSKVTATSLDPVLVTSSLQTTATILMSGDNLTANNMSMQWRTRTTAEAAAGNTNGIISDVLSLTDMGTDLFVLQMSYDQSASGMEDSIESAMAASGILRLGWKNGPTATDWTTATVGNNGNNTQGSLAVTNFQGSWAQFLLANPGLTPSTLSDYLGSYGVDTSPAGGGNVWAVLNHNSEFAVIPEPSTLVLGAIGILGFGIHRLRRKKLA
jgi:hypothetical protein